MLVLSRRVISDAPKARKLPKAIEILPRGFRDAGNLAGESELTELNTRNTELADVCARTAAHGAAVLNADGRRIAWELLQLLRSGEELVIGGSGIMQDSLELGALGGVLGDEARRASCCARWRMSWAWRS